MQEFRRRRPRRFAAVLVSCIALLSSAPALADDSADADGSSIGQQVVRVGEATFDVLLLRPLGAIATVGGFGCFLLTAPLLAPSWEIAYGWDTFVLGPYDYTIDRPLGDF